MATPCSLGGPDSRLPLRNGTFPKVHVLQNNISKSDDSFAKPAEWR